MTTYLGIRDPGRSGGSWLMHLCNVHLADMRIIGEAHLPSELDLPWPGISMDEYDVELIKCQKTSNAQKGITTP